jgi:hypothetical protein
MYIEPWHADVFDFLDLRKNHGIEEQRARDLFYGMWTPDLFMKRVEVCPRLSRVPVVKGAAAAATFAFSSRPAPPPTPLAGL